MMACSRISFVTRGLAFVLLYLLVVAQANAQDPVLSELYGRGVHHYFSGRYTQAYDTLHLAISEGDLDPRAYYFRGLTYIRLGRPDEAQADFTRAAELEVENTSSAFNVGRSLERIQGRDRMAIELHRRMARVAARSKKTRRTRARYEEFKEGESRALQGSGNTPLPPPVPPTPDPVDSTDPFGKKSGAGGGNKTPPAPKSVKPSDDPFSNDVDPFGKPNSAPAPKSNAKTDPFADEPVPPPAPADKNPVPPPAPADKKPVPPPVKPADDDPFGSDPFG